MTCTRRLLSGLFVLSLGVAPTYAQSTINPNIPAQNALLSSPPIRGNFGAAQIDINGILGMHVDAALAGCPVTALNGEDCLVTTTTPAVWYKRYSGGWGEIGVFNLSTGIFVPLSGGV